MTSWIDGDADMAVADYPFHAGVTVDLIGGNSAVCYEQSGYDLQSYSHESTVASHTFAASDTFEDLTPEFGSWPIEVRRNSDGTLKDIYVAIEGKASLGSTIAVRVYMLPSYRIGLGPDASEGLGTGEAYCTLTFQSSSYSVQSATLTPRDDSVGTYAGTFEWLDSDPMNQVEEGSLQAIAISDAVQSLQLRAPRFREVTS